MNAKLRQIDGAGKPGDRYHADRVSPGVVYDRMLCKTCAINRICPLGRNGGHNAGYTEPGVTQPRPLQRGEYVFRQGDKFDHIYVIRAGGVKIPHTTYDGVEQILNFYLRGDILSLGDIEAGFHTTSAITLETTSVCKLSLDRIRAVCREEPVLYDQLLRLASREIASEHRKVILLGQKQSDERFAAFVLDMAERNRRNGYSHREFNLSMSRHDIANYLCLADETVSRLITKFCKEGLLEVDRRSIRIADHGRLAEKAGARAAASAYLN